MGYIAQSINTILQSYNYNKTLIKRTKTLFENDYSHYTLGCFAPSLFQISPVVLGKKIFQFRQCIFAILLWSPFVKGRGPSFEQTWIPLPQDAYCQIWLKLLARWFGEKSFKIFKTYKLSWFFNVFSLFRYFPPPPLEKGVALKRLSKVEPCNIENLWQKLLMIFVIFCRYFGYISLMISY